MKLIRLPYIGSFQTGPRVNSEHPLREVWSQISRIGTLERMASQAPANKEIDWNEHCNYAIVRIRQAVEFRNAAATGTLLSAPLSFYYSFLNLVRAFLAVGPKVIPRRGHGLKYRAATNLLDTAAEIRAGTFADFLEARQASLPVGTTISLQNSLARIAELVHLTPSSYDWPVLVEEVGVTAKPSYFALEFRNGNLKPADFASTWQTYYPQLPDRFELGDEDYQLRLKDAAAVVDYKAACDLCHEFLMPPLTLQEAPQWFIERRSPSDIVLPRVGYYFVAMFILGSIVRYEPQLLRELSSGESELGWFLERFLRTAERFFPQLMLWWLHEQQIYF